MENVTNSWKRTDNDNPLAKRRFERNDFDTPVVFSDDQIKEYHNAMMYNFSDHGMYFESHAPLRQGSTVFVKTLNYCSVNKCQVRWCRKIDSEGKEVFGIGLECDI